MKKKVLMVLVALTLTLSMVLGILAGCGAPATPTATVAPTGTATSKPTATAKPTTTAAPTPAKAGEVFKLTLQNCYPSSGATYWLWQETINNMMTASGGRLVIEHHPVGAILSQLEVFDGVWKGAVDAGIGPDTFWAGKNKIFDLHNQISGGFTAVTQLSWWFYSNPDGPGVGTKFADDLWAQYNMVAFPLSMGAPEAEYIANKPIIKPADYKGLTFRGAGWSMEVLADPLFGAKPTFVPTTDVYSALQTGVIDACELGNPWGNWKGGYYDITKFSGFPGIHNLGEVKHLFINKDVWKKLPADLRKIIEVCLAQNVVRELAYVMVENANVMPKLIEKGITFTYSSPETQKLWQDCSFRLCDQYAAKDPKFAEQWKLMKEFQYSVDRYLDLQTPKYGPDYPGAKETYKGIKF